MAEKGRVRIGIIGTGFARTVQIPGFRACGEAARVVAIASGRRENAERVAREFGIPAVCDSWRDVVAREDVDLVSIVTPPVTHLEMTLAALDAGKAVLCEKPMAMTAVQADAMRERARAAGLFAHVDHELRFLPARRKMRELLKDGAVGRVRHAKFNFRAGSRSTPARPWDWWSDAGAGGGVLGAIGSHAVDTLRWLVGAEVAEVSCALATHVRERPVEGRDELRAVTTDDEANLLLRFADSELTEGATGTIALSVVEPGEPEHVVEIFGTRGALRMSRGDRLWRAGSDAREWQPVEVRRADLAPGMHDDEWARGFTALAREIVRALGEGRYRVEGAADFDDGYQIQRVLDAARRSHESGCRERVSSES
ncbi:MAG TPA: Gfo/Idh/MocA family oxidoreductase [Pyrinomonadaceae bacterium]|nr:Gfo/Idh/MocA family oxidoreductase [Pyrinomonadaceae bacterium]